MANDPVTQHNQYPLVDVPDTSQIEAAKKTNEAIKQIDEDIHQIKDDAAQLDVYSRAEIDQAIQAAKDEADQAIQDAQAANGQAIQTAVDQSKDDLLSGATAAFDTLQEIEAELNSGSSARAALTAQIAGKLGNAASEWHKSSDGKDRILFQGNGPTYHRGGSANGDQHWQRADGTPAMYMHRDAAGHTYLDLFGKNDNTGGGRLRFFDGPGHEKANWELADIDGIYLDIHAHNGSGNWAHTYRLDHWGNIFTPAYGHLHDYFMRTARFPWVIFDGRNGAIHRSNRISSVSRLGVGFYQVNFPGGTFADASYLGSGSAQKEDGNNDGNTHVQVGGHQGAQQGVNHTFVFTGRNDVNGATDFYRVGVFFFGGW